MADGRPAGRLDGRVAIVTGASRGIGAAIARRLAAEGAAVGLVARSKDDLAAVEAGISQAGGRAASVVADLAEASSAERIVAEVMAALGPPLILVNNAGITRDNLILRMSPAQWHDVIELNLSGAFRVTQAALKPMLKARYGRIVTVTSVVGLHGNPGQTNYAAAKAGLIGFTKSLAKEVASRNITANAVAPGYIETDMTGALEGQARDKLLSIIPARRAGLAEEVASAVAFLVLEEAAYVTGEVLRVDGGMGM